jgi:hypothetical protein
VEGYEETVLKKLELPHRPGKGLNPAYQCASSPTDHDDIGLSPEKACQRVGDFGWVGVYERMARSLDHDILGVG